MAMGSWVRRWDGAELWGVALLSGFVLLATLGPLVVSMAVSPEAIERGDVQLSAPCAFRERTGLECATCGLTRGFACMSRLRLSDAFAYNAGAPWIYAVFWILALASGAILGRVALEASSRRARRTAPPRFARARRGFSRTTI